MSLTTGMEYSPTSATGTGCERTPWRATQRPAWARKAREQIASVVCQIGSST